MAGKVKREFIQNVMQRPNPDSIYYDEFIQLQEKLRDRILSLRKSRNMVQEDMADYELSVRQYQRMEQDPTAIVSLWQLFKLAKAHNLDIHDLLDL
ncbi:MAG: helix-turn-helix domain-containing protein [Porticoccaceae bacterium]